MGPSKLLRMRKKDCRFGNGTREGELGEGWERREKRRERSSVVDMFDKHRCWIEGEKESMKRAKPRVMSVALISKAPSSDSELHRSLRGITLRLSSVKLPNDISDLFCSTGYPPSSANIPTWPLNQRVWTVFAKVELVIVWKRLGRWDKGMCSSSILSDVMLGNRGRDMRSRVTAVWKVGGVVRDFGLERSLDLSLAMEDNEGVAGSGNLKCQRRILRLFVLVATNGSLQVDIRTNSTTNFDNIHQPQK